MLRIARYTCTPTCIYNMCVFQKLVTRPQTIHSNIIIFRQEMDSVSGDIEITHCSQIVAFS